MVWEVGHLKTELGKPGTVGFISIERMSVVVRNNMIVEKTAEIHDSLQRIPVMLASLNALRVNLSTILSLAGVGDYAQNILRGHGSIGWGVNPTRKEK